MAEARDLYAAHQFSRVYSLLQQFGTSDLSNFYLDVAKDRLYISAAAEPRRRSCQTVLAALLEGFAVCLAPLLPHLAEDIWQFVPYETGHASVFEAGWEGVARDEAPRSEEDKALWAQARRGPVVARDAARYPGCSPLVPPPPFGGHPGGPGLGLARPAANPNPKQVPPPSSRHT